VTHSSRITAKNKGLIAIIRQFEV